MAEACSGWRCLAARPDPHPAAVRRGPGYSVVMTPVDTPGSEGRGRPVDGGDDRTGNDLPANRRLEPAAATRDAIERRIASLRRASAEKLGFASEDVNVLEDHFDGDLHAFARWKRGIGEALPDGVEELLGSDDRPPTEDPEAVMQDSDPDQPPALRAEWRGLLAGGTVERVGLGIVDERARAFFPKERRIADLVAKEGRVVTSRPEDHSQFEARKCDAEVDGVPTEFKTLESPSDSAVRNQLRKALLQFPWVLDSHAARPGRVGASPPKLSMARPMRGSAEWKPKARRVSRRIRVFRDSTRALERS